MLDPLSLNLAPVPDLYEAFMKTLLKPARRPRPAAHSEQEASSNARGGPADRADRRERSKRGKGGSAGVEAEGRVLVTSAGSRAGGGGSGATGLAGYSKPVIDERLVAVFTKKLRAAGGASTSEA